MELADNVDEDEDENWSAAFYEGDEDIQDKKSDGTPSKHSSPNVCTGQVSVSPKAASPGRCHNRVVIHIDIDCFYAQVEILHNPALKDKPVGVQQKNLLVTCNYVARGLGVKKYCPVQNALRACPQLVLVNGEDLTKYRNMSFKITEFFQQFTPHVERLGFDENYLDVTDLLSRAPWCHLESENISGHDYGAKPDALCPCGCHQRLLKASHLAFEIRAQLYQTLGITSCGGIAHNKLLAKLVSGTHKPNQQTTIFCHQVGTLMLGLDGVRRIPGIGESLAKKLETLNVTTIPQLQACERHILAGEFSADQVAWLTKVAHGDDDQPVLPTRPQQSMSEEDSFRKCESLSAATKMMEDMVKSLLHRVLEDGRTPQVLRVSVRRYSSDDRKRESRQCPIPAGVFRCLKQGFVDTAQTALVDLAGKLFAKVVDPNNPFNMNVLNICLTKFTEAPMTASTPISKFFVGSNVRAQSVEGASGSLRQSNECSENSNNCTDNAPILKASENHGKRDRDGNLRNSTESNRAVKSSLANYFKRESVTKAEMSSCHSENGLTQDIMLAGGERLPLSEGTDSNLHNTCNKTSSDLVPAATGEAPVECNTHQSQGRAPPGECLKQCSYADDGASPSNPSKRLCTSNIHSDDFETRRTPYSETTSNNNHVTCLLPPDIDAGVFQELPKDIQQDILSQYSGKHVAKRLNGVNPHSTQKVDVSPDKVSTSGDNGRVSSDEPTDKLAKQDPAVVEQCRKVLCGTDAKPCVSMSPADGNGVLHGSKHLEQTASEQGMDCDGNNIISDHNVGSELFMVSPNIEQTKHETCPERNHVSETYSYHAQHTSVQSAEDPGPSADEFTSCPPHLDISVFKMLPPDIQREIWTEWKNKQNNNLFSPKLGVKPSLSSRNKSPKSQKSKGSIEKYFQFAKKK